MGCPGKQPDVRQKLTSEEAFVVGTRLRYDQLLWGIVLVAAGADIVLTLFGLSLCFTEANPVARAMLNLGGGAGLCVLKGGALAVLFGVYRYVRPLYARSALAAFSLPQLLAVGHNSVLLIRHAPRCV